MSQCDELIAHLQPDQSLLRSRDLHPHHSLSLAYRHLSVRGEGGPDDVAYGPDLGGILFPWKARSDKKKVARLMEARVDAEDQGGDGAETGRGEGMVWSEGDSKPGKGEAGLRPGERYLLKDFSGLVKAGEMMLVVGRPGSGCTTFLKAIAGLHQGYAGVDGEVFYGAMDEKALQPYRNEVIFCSEEDTFYADLRVGPTLDFALRNNTPAPGGRIPSEEGGEVMGEKQWQDKTKGELLKIFGLEHTSETKIGDQYVQGVSGESANASNSADARR